MKRLNLVLLSIAVVLLAWNTYTLNQQATDRTWSESKAAEYMEQGYRLAEQGHGAAANASFDLAYRIGSGQHAHGAWLVSRQFQAEAVIRTRILPSASALDEIESLAALLANEEGDAVVQSKLLGTIALRIRNESGKALEALNTLQAKHPDYVWVRWQLALALIDAGQVTDAIPHLEFLASAQKTDHRVHHAFALALGATKKPAEAQKAFNAAIEAGGGAQAHLDLGKFFFTQQAWDSALKHLTISLSSSQNGGAAVVRMIAASQHHLKQHAMAAENFKRAYQLEKDPRTLLSAAIAHHAGGQHTESVGVLKLLLGQEKQIPEIHFQLALAFTALKQTQAAKASLQRYLSLAQGMKSQVQTVKQAIALLGGPKKTANGPQGAPSTPTPPKK